MATNKRFADALLDRAEPGPAVELQRRFVGEYFDALAQGGTLLLRAAGEAAGQSSERQTAGAAAPKPAARRRPPGGPGRPRRTEPEAHGRGVTQKRERRSGKVAG
jgi:hypothetical protein